MKRTIIQVAFLMLAGLVMIMASGCRQTRARGDWTTQRPAPPFTDPDALAGVGDLGVDDLAAWSGLGQPPALLPGDLREVEDARISGILVYFAFDRSAIGEAERPKLERIAAYMVESPEYHLVIEGHCDERGSAEYNRGLGERRALAVRDYLVDLGIESNRLHTVSYGIERPAVPNATTEREHARNRRAEFRVGVPR